MLLLKLRSQRLLEFRFVGWRTIRPIGLTRDAPGDRGEQLGHLEVPGLGRGHEAQPIPVHYLAH